MTTFAQGDIIRLKGTKQPMLVVSSINHHSNPWSMIALQAKDEAIIRVENINPECFETVTEKSSIDLLSALECLAETAPIDIDAEDNIDAYRKFVYGIALKAITKANP